MEVSPIENCYSNKSALGCHERPNKGAYCRCNSERDQSIEGAKAVSKDSRKESPHPRSRVGKRDKIEGKIGIYTYNRFVRLSLKKTANYLPAKIDEISINVRHVYIPIKATVAQAT